jgi:hypothetical protein
VVSFLVVEEIKDKQNMSEIHKAIALSSFLKTKLVHWNFQVIKSILVVFVEIIPDLCLGVSTRYVLNHKVSPSFITIEDLHDVYWSTIILSLARSKTLLGVLLLHFLTKRVITILVAIVTTTAMRPNGTLKELLSTQTTTGIRNSFIAMLLWHLSPYFACEDVIHLTQVLLVIFSTRADVAHAACKMDSISDSSIVKIPAHWGAPILRAVLTTLTTI